MKKYILLLLIILVSPMMAQENKQAIGNFPYINNTFKMYVALGLPIGLGFLYAPEFRSSLNDNVLQVVSFDVKFLGFSIIPEHLMYLGITASVQYSVGTILVTGSRFYVDLIGAGWGFAPGQMYFTLNTPGFQSTLHNGFYWAVRTAINFSKSYCTGSLLVGFEGYLAIGYDFGKKINPKDYESRMR
ncbi:MAG: hypothetical protein ACRCTQ_07035 [Brevinemataceae bacterium]